MSRAYLAAATLVALAIGVPGAGGSPLAPATPTISSSTPPSPANQNNPVLNGTADAGTTVDLYTDSACTGAVVGTGAADASSGEFHIPVTVAVPDNAATTFYATATDATPSTSPCSDGFTYVEDSSPPPAPDITSGPQGVVGSSSATFTFSDAEPVASFSCQLDGGNASDCSSGSQSYSALSDGTHLFEVTARDAAGNDSVAASRSWTIDTVHPLVTITDKPPLLTNRTTASFSFTANHPGSTFECRLDGAQFDGCTSPKLYSGLGNGSHTFAVRAISLGNVGPATTYTWTVDTVPPQTAIASAPPAQSTSPIANFTFTSSERGSSFSCSLDAAGFSPCASPKAYTGLGDGTHVFRVEAVDPAGNVDASAATYTWTITGVGPPTVDHTPPGNVTKLRRSVGYGVLRLRWRRPADSDFDHVRVFVATRAKGAARAVVYSGRSQSYTNKRFKNGLYYRYLVVSYDHADNGSRGARTVVPPSVLLRSPRNGAVVHSPPVLRWAAVRKASFYNVQVYNRGQKILSAWPVRAHRALVRRWVYSGRGHTLRKGTYVWWVWPGFGPKARSRYGQLLGQGTFKVR